MNSIPCGDRYDACNGDTSREKYVQLRHFVHMHAEVRVVMVIDCFADRRFLPRYILTCLCISMTFESCRFGVLIMILFLSLYFLPLSWQYLAVETG